MACAPSCSLFRSLDATVLLLGGLSSYINMQRSESPGFIVRAAVVQTIFPGASPGRMELLVTDKEAPSAAADTNPMATAAAKQADAVSDAAKPGTKAKSVPASSKKK